MLQTSIPQHKFFFKKKQQMSLYFWNASPVACEYKEMGEENLLYLMGP